MRDFSHIRSDYLNEVLDCESLKERIDNTVKLLRRKTKQFDAIAFRGMSGALVAPAVAARLKKNLLMVRKESAHSNRLVEGIRYPQRYIIVDDFISSGATVQAIRGNLDKEHTLVGVVCYAWLSWRNQKRLQLTLGTKIWITGHRGR